MPATNEIIQSGQADVVVLARELQRAPNWPLHPARSLNYDFPMAVQYERGKP